MVQILGRVKVWAGLFLASAVALIVVGVIGEDRRSGALDSVHSGVRVVCLLLALVLVIACVGNVVRRRSAVNVIAAVLVVLGAIGLIVEGVSALSAGPGDADIGGGGIILLGFVVMLVAGLISQGPESRD